jgi:hypothetical protein
MIITKYWHVFTIIQLLIIKYKDSYLPELALTPKSTRCMVIQTRNNQIIQLVCTSRIGRDRSG